MRSVVSIGPHRPMSIVVVSRRRPVMGAVVIVTARMVRSMMVSAISAAGAPVLVMMAIVFGITLVKAFSSSVPAASMTIGQNGSSEY